jgi:hypothetical protein
MMFNAARVVQGLGVVAISMLRSARGLRSARFVALPGREAPWRNGAGVGSMNATFARSCECGRGSCDYPTCPTGGGLGP